MTKKEFCEFMESKMIDALQNNGEELKKHLLHGLCPEDTSEEKYAKLIINAVYVSAQLAYKNALKTLCDLDIITDDDIAEKPLGYCEPAFKIVIDPKDFL